MTTLLRGKEVADQFGIRKATLDKWRSQGTGPVYTKVGGSVRYTPEAVETYLKKRAVTPGSAKRQRKAPR